VRLHSPNIFATKAATVSDDLNIVTGSQSVAIHGRITVANSGQMRTALTNLLRTKPACIAVDLSGVSYIDSSGVATLIEAARIARGQSTRLTVRGMHDQPRYFFEIAHLDQFFDSTGQEPSK
jgi:anti-sigma B factor antagonist